ncbi:unnamed protein product [Fraxinus pennsylvanica]|uniref:Uncharacterized protein n=1 Tax=Fraxinus pennsylvanica TaxID=56036 RepID=A0AAD2ADY5_9LAMI|nr:unnamed protein product [Fraxinus pennsylvanica]
MGAILQSRPASGIVSKPEEPRRLFLHRLCYLVPFQFTIKMSEEPFRPREKLVEKQKFFQSVHKHTYLKGRYDKITSVAIPLALAATSLFMIGRGIYNLSHGIGKKE